MVWKETKGNRITPNNGLHTDDVGNGLVDCDDPDCSSFEDYVGQCPLSCISGQVMKRETGAPLGKP